MKKMKLSLLAVALMVATAASAQVSFGIQGGVNLSNITPDNNPKVGFNVGLLTDFGLTHNMGIRSGLSFTTKGACLRLWGGNSRITLQYLQIPVHFAYKVDVTPGTRVVFQGGPYAAFGIGNHFGNEDDRYNPFDFGLGIGVGFEFGRFLTGIGWDMGLLTISNVDSVAEKNQNAHLTVGFRF